MTMGAERLREKEPRLLIPNDIADFDRAKTADIGEFGKPFVASS